MTRQTRHLSYRGDSMPVYRSFCPRDSYRLQTGDLYCHYDGQVCCETLTHKVPQEETVPPPPVKLSPLTGTGHIGLQPESDGLMTTARKPVGKQFIQLSTAHGVSLHVALNNLR